MILHDNEVRYMNDDKECMNVSAYGRYGMQSHYFSDRAHVQCYLFYFQYQVTYHYIRHYSYCKPTTVTRE